MACIEAQGSGKQMIDIFRKARIMAMKFVKGLTSEYFQKYGTK